MPRGWQRELGTVYTRGTIAGLTDAELLRRFLDGDGAGFEGLVARHGPMVKAVCRAALRDGHDAEDAFQATFLVLVRKARSLRFDDSVGPWLYGVACRVARHARSDAARRNAREGKSAVGDPAGPAPESSETAELRALVHEELGRLPESFRAPLVLCHLEGLTQEEAARRLCCPLGTVRSRLARGRERLRRRLLRRGAAPALASTAMETAGSAARATVPVELAGRTAAAALAGVNGLVTAGAAGSAAFILSRKAVLSMSLASLKSAAVGAAGGLFVTAAVVVAAGQAPGSVGGANPGQAPAGPAGARPASASKPQEPGPEGPRAGGVMPEELAGRYRAALSRWEAVESLATRASLSAREVELLRNGERGAARNALGLARTEIAAQKRGWEEELEIQEIQLKRARGTLARAVAQRDLAGAIVSRNDRLNGRIKGAVSVEEITKAEAEQKVAEGEILVRQADVEEAETRIRQLKRRIADLPNLSPTPPASKQE